MKNTIIFQIEEYQKAKYFFKVYLGYEQYPIKFYPKPNIFLANTQFI